MGYYVVTTGNMPDLQGHQFADEYIPADYSDGSYFKIGTGESTFSKL